MWFVPPLFLWPLGRWSGKGLKRGGGHKDLSQAVGHRGRFWTLKAGGRTPYCGLRAGGPDHWQLGFDGFGSNLLELGSFAGEGLLRLRVSEGGLGWGQHREGRGR